MALPKALLIPAATMAVVVGAPLPATAWPDNHLVGDFDGWKLGVDYDDWVSRNDHIIPAGDTLEFRYSHGEHTVVMVDLASYGVCAVLDPQNAPRWDSGDDKVQLTDAGTTYYFICDVADHCEQGMRLAITTV